MSAAGKFQPAKSWRAFFLLLIPIAWVHAASPIAPPDQLSQLGKPSAEEAAKFLEEFRRSGMPTEYFLEFQLQSLPRRGESKLFSGRLWAGRNRDGAVSRIEVTDGRRHRLLIQDGPKPSIWREVDGKVTQLGVDELFRPIIPGVEATAFDLQRSYLNWPDATLQSINRVLGRPAYAFLFRPPAGFVAGNSGVASVRVYLDTQFKQPLQSELLDAAGKVLKTFVVVSLKTVDVDAGKEESKQTLPKEVDFRNDRTRDKTRLRIVAAGFRVNFPGGLFDPGRLGEDAAVPAPDRLVRLEP
jgi:negative regulator of sigma E activity